MRPVNKHMLLAQVAADLERHESFKRFAFPDPLSLLGRKYRGFPWGRKPSRELLSMVPEGEEHGRPWIVGIDFAIGVTPDHIMELYMARQKLKESLNFYWNGLTKVVPNIQEYPYVIQTVLLNMIFDLGEIRLGKFKGILELLRKHSYAEAADSLEKSLWYRQKGTRAAELVDRVRDNAIKKEHLANA